jgi:hypothetical protein
MAGAAPELDGYEVEILTQKTTSRRLFNLSKKFIRIAGGRAYSLGRTLKSGVALATKIAILGLPGSLTGRVSVRLIRQRDFLENKATACAFPLLAKTKVYKGEDIPPAPTTEAPSDFREPQNAQSLYYGVVNNAIVRGGSHMILCDNVIIYNDQLDINTEYTSEELHGLITINAHRKKAYLKLAKPIKHIHEAVSFTDACAANYAHWLTETLSKVALWSSLNKNNDIRHIIDKSLPRQMYQSLEPFLIKGTKVCLLDANVSLHIKDLHVVSPTGYVPFDNRYHAVPIHHGWFDPYALSLVREKCIAFYTANNVAANYIHEKIYIKRNSSVRNLTNNSDVERHVANAGYVLCDPGSLSFDQQVRLFSSAKNIIAPTGAACANILFARKDAIVDVLMPEHPDTAYEYWSSIGASVGVKVRNVLGKPAPGSAGCGRHCPYSIDLSDLPV